MKKHILYIEDDIVDRMCFERIFADRSHDFVIKMIESIADLKQEEALETYDLIITDMFLGDGGAKEVLEWLEDRKVILLSGETDPEYITRMLPDQLLATITKPVTFESLSKVLPSFFSENVSELAPKAESMSGTSMINLTNIERMAKGNKDYMIELVDLALELFPQRMGSLTQAVESENWHKYHQTAHSMKSLAKMVGIPIYDLLHRMDREARDQPVPEELLEMYRTLMPQMEEAEEQLKNIRKKLDDL